MEINLFEKRLGKVKKRLRIKLILTRSIIFWVMVMVMVMIVLSCWSLWVNKTNLRLSQDIKTVKQKIEELEKVESQQVYLTSKLDSFKTLIQSQKKHQAVTETILALIPMGTELKGFKVEESGQIKLTGSLPDYETLEELLSRIKNINAYQVPITQAKVNRITVNSEGSLTFDIEIEVKV